MAPKFKDGDVVLAFSGKWVSWAHTAAAYGVYLQFESFVNLRMFTDGIYSCFPRCADCGHLVALPQDCPE